jgi:hypothetical protein
MWTRSIYSWRSRSRSSTRLLLLTLLPLMMMTMFLISKYSAPRAKEGNQIKLNQQIIFCSLLVATDWCHLPCFIFAPTHQFITVSLPAFATATLYTIVLIDNDKEIAFKYSHLQINICSSYRDNNENLFFAIYHRGTTIVHF